MLWWRALRSLTSSIVLYIRFSGNQKQSVPIFTLWKFNNMALTLRSQLLWSNNSRVAFFHIAITFVVMMVAKQSVPWWMGKWKEMKINFLLLRATRLLCIRQVSCIWTIRPAIYWSIRMMRMNIVFPWSTWIVCSCYRILIVILCAVICVVYASLVKCWLI